MYILQHFRQTFTVCERLDFTLFVAAKETRPPLSASLSPHQPDLCSQMVQLFAMTFWSKQLFLPRVW